MKYFEREMPTENPTGCKAMTWEDAEEMEKLNLENGWGFSDEDLLRIIADYMEAFYKHMDAYDNEEILKYVRVMEKITWRLTDANFHTLSGLLNENKFKEAVSWVADQMLEKGGEINV